MKRIFLSYSSADRDRVTGIGHLLRGLGLEVFVDHLTIKPGMRWEAALQKGLDEADFLLVYWTRWAARSDWVRREYEHVHKNYPERPIIPLLADETPLPEILGQYQHCDFFPLISELRVMKRSMKESGKSDAEIESAIAARLSEADIRLNERQKKDVFRAYGLGVATGVGGVGGIWAILSVPWARARRAARGTFETLSQLPLPKVAMLAGTISIAGAVAFVIWPRDQTPTSTVPSLPWPDSDDSLQPLVVPPSVSGNQTPQPALEPTPVTSPSPTAETADSRRENEAAADDKRGTAMAQLAAWQEDVRERERALETLYGPEEAEATVRTVFEQEGIEFNMRSPIIPSVGKGISRLSIPVRQFYQGLAASLQAWEQAVRNEQISGTEAIKFATPAMAKFRKCDAEVNQFLRAYLENWVSAIKTRERSKSTSVKQKEQKMAKALERLKEIEKLTLLPPPRAE